MTTRSFLSLEEKSRLVVKLLMPSFSASVPLDEALATTAGSYGIIVFKIDEDFVSHHYIMMSSVIQVIVFFLMRAAVALLCVRRVRLLCAGKAQSKKRKLDNNNHQKVYSQ